MQDLPLDLLGTPAFVPGRQRRVVLETEHLIEAPNWSPDGRTVYFSTNDCRLLGVSGGRGLKRGLAVSC